MTIYGPGPGLGLGVGPGVGVSCFSCRQDRGVRVVVRRLKRGCERRIGLQGKNKLEARSGFG